MFDLFSNRNDDFSLWESELSIDENIEFNEKTSEEDQEAWQFESLNTFKANIIVKTAHFTFILAALKCAWTAL